MLKDTQIKALKPKDKTYLVADGDALFTYHSKFNEATQQFSQKPEHTWELDYADAFRAFAVADHQRFLTAGGGTYEPHINK